MLLQIEQRGLKETLNYFFCYVIIIGYVLKFVLTHKESYQSILLEQMK